MEVMAKQREKDKVKALKKSQLKKNKQTKDEVK